MAGACYVPTLLILLLYTIFPNFIPAADLLQKYCYYLMLSHSPEDKQLKCGADRTQEHVLHEWPLTQLSSVTVC